MTDKEFWRMSRGDLVGIIHQYQKKEQELQQQITSLTAQLEDRRIKIEKAGSIADAVLTLNHVLESAQSAADQYLAEIHAANADTEARTKQLLDDANQKVSSMMSHAQDECASLRSQTEADCAALRKQAEAECGALRDKVLQLLRSHDELKSLLHEQDKSE